MDGGGAAETVEQMQARHRKEAKDLQGRVTSKKKNATKKTRKGVNDECAEMERQMKQRQAEELEGLAGGGKDGGDTQEDDDDVQGQDGRGDTTQGELAAKMRAMGVNELAAKPPQQPSKPPDEGSDGAAVGGGGAGPGKKRNRQKERLARRAAEQEAAAEAAEQEAAGMTDHRGQERERMEAEFSRHGLEEHEIRPDGHCLFSAVADQLGQAGVPLMPSGADGEAGDGKEPGYKTVRRAAAGYIEARGDEFAGFLEEDLGSYVRKIRDTAEWGGQLELLALASVYGVEVCVVQDGRTEVIQPSGGGEQGGEDRKKVWLAYYRHGYGLGEHYNSLRKKA
ncbi:hypothetical protein INS49_012248 [Diaporthe citri]|uniref:uncharacterized protein n=1 Tax=Diaporthe citri TaxID=83186 RepID=UPI001C7F8E1B|nr:uncharacterized protein INS49_012248 [Diaporthe citri]KAG6358729.1 hypothetical protein INS49_012248 [Diaporthe citri]